MKLSEAMRERMLLSFELFPPKTEKGMDNLPGTIDHLMKYKPAYISCTYGAGGGNVGANREVCQMIRNAGTVPVTHFTVIKNTKEGIRQQLEQYLADGVDHMLALRGDIPLGETTTCGDFNYATDLVKFVRDEFGDKFEIAVAGSPEGHIACRSLDADIAVLRQKQDNGADYIMTQLCWDMEQFKYWLDAIREAGVTMPVDVGVMPILDQAATINMALSRNGCVMDSELCRLISRNWLFPNPFNAKDADGKPFDMFYEDKVKRFKEEGIEYTIRQIDEYRALGVDGIHLYALNKWNDLHKSIKEVVRYAKMRNINVKMISPLFPVISRPGLEVLQCVTPIGFLNLILNADTVITDSYHGTIFSINFEKEMYSINGANESDIRKTDILSRVGLQDRIIKSASDMCGKMFTKIDYKIVRKKLEAQRKTSVEYLEKALKYDKQNKQENFIN